jgi:hypothetical protein
MLNSKVIRDWLAECNFDYLRYGPNTSQDITGTAVSVSRGPTLVNICFFLL